MGAQVLPLRAMTGDEPQVLRPFHRAEAISTAEAAEIAGRPVRTIRQWAVVHNLGRRIRGGPYDVSKVALAMFLDGDRKALAAYLAGDRGSPAIRAYFERCGVPLPQRREVAR